MKSSASQWHLTFCGSPDADKSSQYRRHDFSQAELGVLVLDKTDFDEDGKRKPGALRSPLTSDVHLADARLSSIGCIA